MRAFVSQGDAERAGVLRRLGKVLELPDDVVENVSRQMRRFEWHDTKDTFDVRLERAGVDWEGAYRFVGRCMRFGPETVEPRDAGQIGQFCDWLEARKEGCESRTVLQKVCLHGGGGGVHVAQDIGALLRQGADDVSIYAAVAAFGMLLRESPYRGQADWSMVINLAGDSLGRDEGGLRRLFGEQPPVS